MRKPPLGAKIVSLVVMFLSLPFFATSLIIFLSSGVVRQGIENMLGGVFAGVLLFVGVFFFALALAYFFLGLGLWRGREWARVVIVFLSGIWLFFSVAGILVGAWPSLGSFAINLFFTWYFMRKKVRKAYR